MIRRSPATAAGSILSTTSGTGRTSRAARRWVCGWLVLAFTASSAGAGEVGFTETYVLAPERTAALQQLLPGTEDYFYYHCLHHQQLEQYPRVEQLLSEWIKRFKYTPRVREILNRQALLTYERDPQKALSYLRDQLKLKFDHQQTAQAAKRQLPAELDQNLISHDRLDAIALQQKRNLDGFEELALRRLSETKLQPERRRALLQRLTNPDTPQLVEHILADLAHYRGTSFGQFPVHHKLLLDQLQELRQKRPELINDTAFVQAYLLRLQPRNGIDWRHSDQEYDQFLTRMWEFVSELPPAQNSLKGHVLYHRLRYDQKHGRYDRKLFDAYLQLPRVASYVSPRYLQSLQNRVPLVNLRADFSGQTLLPPIGDDTALIRQYLAHFFETDTSYERYTSRLRDTFVKKVFADTKLVLGLGDAEQWYSMLTPAELQALKERVDLNFAPTNRDQFQTDEPVAIELDVKNVRTLIVKVFELNTRNYYTRNLKEIDTNINLDGLVPNWEYTHEYEDPPLKLARRQFTFPELNREGVFVVDFIGSGRSSRIVIRKGKLRALPRVSAAGLALTIVDQQSQPRPEATVWLEGKRYSANNNGEIVIPFSTQPGHRSIVISEGDFSALETIQHAGEAYQLSAAFYVNREQLLPQQKAILTIRPALTLSGVPVALSLLKDVTLQITSTDHDGIQATRTIEDVELSLTSETEVEFQVPNRLNSLSFTLQAKVEQLTTGKPVNLSAGHSVSLNLIDKTRLIEDAHLGRNPDGYTLDVLGRSGEPRNARPVRVVLKHREYRQPVSVMLQSDDAGRIRLGALAGINQVTAHLPAGTQRQWRLVGDDRVHRRLIHTASDEEILIPLKRLDTVPSEISLFEIRGNQPFASHNNRLKIEDATLRIKNLKPGDYRLLVAGDQERFEIRVEQGRQVGSFLVGANRHLQSLPAAPLNIEKISADKSDIKIQLDGTQETTRVHIFATRYLPAFKPFTGLASLPLREPSARYFSTQRSTYLTGRKIGDEYQYIIDRRYAVKFPGNPLQRPGLLLNPWAVRDTQTSVKNAAAGGEFAPDSESADDARSGASGKGQAGSQNSDPSNLSFLTDAGLVVLNQPVAEDGTLDVSRKVLGTARQLHVVAVDTDSVVYRSFVLPEREAEHRDLRLVNILNLDTHFAQLKRVDTFTAEQKFEVADVATSRFEIYDNLGKLFRLLAATIPDTKIHEFEFITRWPSLDDAEQRRLYSKYACHELHVFLARRDPEFFQQVVLPYLVNKKDQTPLDLWLTKAPVDGQFTPWQFARLNTAEQILLSQTMEAEAAQTRRLVLDKFAILQRDRRQLQAQFLTALQQEGLESDEDSVEAGGAPGFFGRGGVGGGGFGGGGMGGRSSNGSAPAATSRFAMPGAPQPQGEAAPSERGRDKAEFEQAEQKLSEMRRRSGSRRAKLNAPVGDLLLEIDSKRRADYQPLYQTLDKTKEWAENNYYELAIANLSPELITVNGFWRDFAAHTGDQPLLSPHIMEATGNLHEVLLALALTDLPFEAGQHDYQLNGPELAVQAAGEMIVFHEQIQPAEPKAEDSPVLISQHFFQADDRYQTVNGVKRDKFVTDEFLIHTVYGCQIVLTNPSSANQRLDVLTQVPAGSIPVENSLYARSRPVDLQPFHTVSVEYYFYFPTAGDFLHYPVQVSQAENHVASAEAFRFHVVNEPSRLDEQSWDFVSQRGSQDDVIAFLKNRNLQEVALNRIAFRMRDKAFYTKCLNVLRDRNMYDHTLWAYSVHHDDPQAINEFLPHADAFVAATGTVLNSPLLTIDPVQRRTYEHLEYRPLVNARVHQLGQKREILNDRFYAQYQRLLHNLTYKRNLNATDRLDLTYYLLLQDRFQEAISQFEQVNPDQLASRLQYDYFAAYLDLFNEEPQLAASIVERYLEYPVDRWQKRFAAISAYLHDISQGTATIVDDQNREQLQASRAASEPALDFVIKDNNIELSYRNLKQIRINYYLMDVELLFSRNPFVEHDAEQFSQIRANHVQNLKLNGKSQSKRIPIPKELSSANVLIEIESGGISQSVAHFSNTLEVQAVRSFGRLQVTQRDSKRPIPKTYVKVYARNKDGRVVFYKDGYTDLLGRFDYSSLSTNHLELVDRFSLLVMSEQHGAIVKEIAPPLP